MILKNENIVVLQIQLFDNPGLILLFFKMVINKVSNDFKIITLKSLWILYNNIPKCNCNTLYKLLYFTKSNSAKNEIIYLKTKNYDGLY